ncbi:hypothetical protein [Pantoea eucrina]|uniref:Uncharacterized protein n=1 Tax=Pantoea eucrina TaxID=472693 RepID=A0ABU5LHB4_9GAMM|nr:hypothetical protein [Pantoea eucrina]MDZ7279330.1 hypothetical protein [Pantoea eucrina]
MQALANAVGNMDNATQNGTKKRGYRRALINIFWVATAFPIIFSDDPQRYAVTGNPVALIADLFILIGIYQFYAFLLDRCEAIYKKST